MKGEAFIVESTALASPPLLPEIRLHLATEVTPLWHATEVHLAQAQIEPPFWAFAWAGGQALARHLLDHAELVRGRRVLDFASGSGLVAIAAALAGAADVIAVELDPLAVTAIGLNARASGVRVDARLADVIESEPEWLADREVILAGDVCYDRAMTDRVRPWLAARARAGALTLLGDPGRAYLDTGDLVELARHVVPTIDDVEGQREKTGVVFRVRGGSSGGSGR